MNKTGLLALARKALDDTSTEAERATSGRMLAKEIVKLLTTDGLLFKTIFEGSEVPPSPMTPAERASADRVEESVRQTVATHDVNTAPESPVTWVEFDPATEPQSPFDGNAFGRKPRKPRR